MHYKITPSTLHGKIKIPSSKSHTLRAILFASLAKGKSVIHDFLPSPDTQAMIQACRLLGADITVTSEKIIVIGTAGQPQTPENIIDAGNSGQVLRFIGAVAALTPGYTVVTGDHSIRTQRPITPLLEALTQLNVFAVSSSKKGSAPIIIRGPLEGGKTTINGEVSQPVSGLLIATAFAKNPTQITVKNPGETTWIDLTLDWFKRLGICYQQEGHTRYLVNGNTQYDGFEYTVPGDFSSAAFPLVAALITDSELILENLDIDDSQGDKVLFFELQKMGADLQMHLDKTIQIKKSKTLVGKKINVNLFNDAVPILAVMGCFSKNKMCITGAATTRNKESDRLSAITTELKKMGANMEEHDDGLTVYPSKLHGAVLDSHQDHRIAMSLAVAALGATGESVIEHTECVAKSFPNFVEALQGVGALIRAD